MLFPAGRNVGIWGRGVKVCVFGNKRCLIHFSTLNLSPGHTVLSPCVCKAQNFMVLIHFWINKKIAEYFFGQQYALL